MVTFDEDRKIVEIDGTKFRLPRTLFMMAAYLAEHPGVIRSRTQIMNAAMEGGGLENSYRSVDSSIKRLRRAGLKQIRIYYGEGYFWDDGIPNAKTEL